MKHKRLKHHGDAIIGILTGWQMVGELINFKKFGKGKYIYDYRTNELKYNDKPIDVFPIFLSIHNWYKNDITKHNIDDKLIKNTLIEVNVYDYLYDVSIVKKKFLWFSFTYPKLIKDYKAKYHVILQTDEMDYSKEAEGTIF